LTDIGRDTAAIVPRTLGYPHVTRSIFMFTLPYGVWDGTIFAQLAFETAVWYDR